MNTYVIEVKADERARWMYVATVTDPGDSTRAWQFWSARQAADPVDYYAVQVRVA